MDDTWERIQNKHNRIIEEIIEFRKIAWGISETEAEKIRNENYFNCKANICADPFYSESNMRHLGKVISDIEAGRSNLVEHDLIED